MHQWNGGRGRLSAYIVLLIALRLAFSEPVHVRQAEPQAKAAGKNVVTTITQVPTHCQLQFKQLLLRHACPLRRVIRSQ